MKPLKLFLAIIFSSLLITCNTSLKPEIYDLIKTLRLTAGQTDTLMISDLWFAPDYDVAFIENPDLNLSYNASSGEIIVSADSAFQGMTLQKFTYINKEYAFPVKVNNLTAQTFKYKLKNKEESVRVIGSFNSWNRLNSPMTDADGDGVYEKTFMLDNGRYEYKFYIDGNEIIDPANKEKVLNNFGQYNSLLVINNSSVERELIPNGYQRRAKTITFKWLYNSQAKDTIDISDIIALQDNQVIAPENISIKNNLLSLEINSENVSPNCVIRMVVANNNFYTAESRVYLNNGEIADQSENKSWRDAIVYSLIIDRFYDGDKSNTQKVNNPELKDKANYYGGDIRGIIEKLDTGYFDNLNVNVIWVSPVNQNPFEAYREYPEPRELYAGYHGYWPIEPEKVDVRFGDMGLLRDMVDKAHQKGMKVMLDFVSNHVHEQHPYYKEHPDWFGSVNLPDGRKNIRFWDEYRLTTWFEPYLPSFDYLASEEALNTVTDNAVWWLKESNADGFRQDAVKHVPNKFWRTLTKKIKEEIEIPENRKIYQIGETFGSYDLISSYVNNGQLDGQFNFNLYETALSAFSNPDVSFKVLDIEMAKTHDVYGMYHLMGNLMDSHDKARFMAIVEGDTDPDKGENIPWNNPPKVDDPDSYKKAQLYITYMMTIPGVPFVYYGDEFGMTGANDPDNRRPMRFGDQLSENEKQMLKSVQKIIKLRKDNSALRYGDFRSIYADKNVYAYLRADMLQKVLIVLNKSSEETVVDLKLPVEYNFKSMIPLYGVKRYSLISNILNADIPAYGALVMLLK
ncbi:MAG: alpha-glucosidase C-terminal domain-containing protein [Calditrichaeota bacterium]|nr:alpha-glucosidase C-terminal domain-containing protein [Calditrichota bacterium]